MKTPRVLGDVFDVDDACDRIVPVLYEAFPSDLKTEEFRHLLRRVFRRMYAKGAFVGLTPRHGKAAMARAVMEGATYAMRDSVEIIKGMGVPVTEVRLSGGGARSGFWARMQAAIYGQETCVINSTEGGAYGVALLAGVAAGVWGSVEEACDATIQVTERFAMDEAERIVYDHYYPIYGSLYRALKPEFKKIADAVAEG